MFSFEAKVVGTISYGGRDGSIIEFHDPVYNLCKQKIIVPGIFPLHTKLEVVVYDTPGNYDPTYDPYRFRELKDDVSERKTAPLDAS